MKIAICETAQSGPFSQIRSHMTSENHLCNILGVLKGSCVVTDGVLVTFHGTRTRVAVHAAMRGTDSLVNLLTSAVNRNR